MRMIFFDMGIVAQLKVCKGCGFFFFNSLLTHSNAYVFEKRGPLPLTSVRRWRRAEEDNPVRRWRRSGSLSGGWVVLMGLICVCLVDGLIGSVCWVWSFAGFNRLMGLIFVHMGLIHMVLVSLFWSSQLMGLLGFKKMNCGLIGSG